jgi:tetratricopeptide (TPR) repeat protein
MDDDALRAARELLASGRFPEAAAALEPLHRKSPMHAETVHALALALAQLGMKDRALVLFEKLVRLAPKDAPAHVNLGTALSQAGRGPEAVAALRRAVELAPQLAGARYNLGVELARAGDAAAAAAELREAVRLNPGAAVFSRELGRLEAQLGNWEAAVAAYRTAVELEGCHADARTELALALEKAGKDDEALAAWAELVREAPLLPTPRNHLVAQLARRGRLEEAEAACRAGAEAAPDNADFLHNLGTLRSMRGDAAGAVAAYRRALLADPSRAETALSAAAVQDPRRPATEEIEHLSPFGESEHRVGVLTFRARSDDDLSRALAHAIPALLAARGAAEGAEVRQVAPFMKGSTRRADVMFDYFDLRTSRIADLTRALRAERWVFGEIAPDLAAIRVRLWTAGAAAEQAEEVPLDLKNPAAALAAAARFARLRLDPKTLPDPHALLHFGLGSTGVVEDLAFDHLEAALRPAPFPEAEAEFVRRALDLVGRGDHAAALDRLDRALAIRPSARTLYLKGQALFATQQFDASRDAWTAAARLDSSLAIPPLPHGWLELRAGRVADAERLFRLASAEESEAAHALVGLGCAAMARRDVAAARGFFKEALEKSPRLPEALFQMSLSYLAENDRPEAERWAGRLEQHHEGHPLVESLARMMGRTS